MMSNQKTENLAKLAIADILKRDSLLRDLMHPTLFHLAFPITDIAQTKTFYAEGLGCQVGRENANSVILNLYEHQLVAHMTHEPLIPQRGVYPRHFGLVFTAKADWEALLERSQHQGLKFYQQPKQRFVDSTLEHYTFFLADPFYNLLEFKFYVHASAIFGEQSCVQIGDPYGNGEADRP